MVYYFIVYFYISIFQFFFSKKYLLSGYSCLWTVFFWNTPSVDRDKHESTKLLSFVNKVLPIAKDNDCFRRDEGEALGFSVENWGGCEPEMINWMALLIQNEVKALISFAPKVLFHPKNLVLGGFSCAKIC